MITKYYDSLPDTPEVLSASGLLQRLLDALGFRYRVATESLRRDDVLYRPVPSSMNIEEVNQHIFNLMRITGRSLGVKNISSFSKGSFQDSRAAILKMIHLTAEHVSNLSDEELSAKTVYLKRMDKSFSFWYLINGYITDALTHVGQINSWRRMSGNPVARISPFTGQPF